MPDEYTEVNETAAEATGAAANNEGPSDDSKNLVRDIVEIAESILINIFVIVMIFTYLLHPVDVEGPSMNNTLNNEDRLLMSTVCLDYSYGDIVIINNDAAYLLDENNDVYKKDITGDRLEECLVKRVIAKPGQTLEIDPASHEVKVDGAVLNEPYIKDPVSDGGVFNYPITIPEGYYFVMGDNRNNSADSRNGYVGLIKKNQIYGKAIVRFSPIKEFKILYKSVK